MIELRAFGNTNKSTVAEMYEEEVWPPRLQLA
jgi:hypothetical protein